MARKKREVLSEVDIEVVDPDKIVVDPDPVDSKVDNKADKIVVETPDETRVYSYETHGEHWRILAKAFKKNKGTK